MREKWKKGVHNCRSTDNGNILLILCKNTAHDYASVFYITQIIILLKPTANTVVGRAQGFRETEK
jgi:hypothetical protein